MNKLAVYILSFLTVAFFSNCHSNQVENSNSDKESPVIRKVFSNQVKDTFYIRVSLPQGYESGKKYPVIYVLDGNLYFEMLCAINTSYAEIGALRQAIIVGVAYKNLNEMDSLRMRDYTYPKAIADYEMPVSGGADKFLKFLNKELIPEMDKLYSVDTKCRILMGHSLGGYFTLYALQQALANNTSEFSGYVAASPALHYNHYYLLRKLEEQTHRSNQQLNILVSYGGLEDKEDGEEPGYIPSDSIITRLDNVLKVNTNFKGEVYSHLGHFNADLPCFVRGLECNFSTSEN